MRSFLNIGILLGCMVGRNDEKIKFAFEKVKSDILYLYEKMKLLEEENKDLKKEIEKMKKSEKRSSSKKASSTSSSSTSKSSSSNKKTK